MPEPTRLASFGTPTTPDAQDTAEQWAWLEYFGTDIRVLADPFTLEIDLEEFLEQAMALEETDIRSIGAVRTLLRRMVHPEDFTTFWKLVRANRQDITAQMEFGKYVMESMTGHPTVQPSGSSPGRLQTVQNSGDDSSLRVQHRLEERGRPDLAVVVLQHREALAG